MSKALKRKTEREVLDHNFKDVLENGPGLRNSRQTTCIARCPNNKHLLHTGLGAHGLGSMWFAVKADDGSVEDLPIQDPADCGCPVFDAYLLCCLVESEGAAKLDHIGIYATRMPTKEDLQKLQLHSKITSWPEMCHVRRNSYKAAIAEVKRALEEQCPHVLKSVEEWEARDSRQHIVGT